MGVNIVTYKEAIRAAEELHYPEEIRVELGKVNMDLPEDTYTARCNRIMRNALLEKFGG